MVPEDIANICPDGILVVGPDHRISWLNDAARRMFGWPGDTLIRQHVNVLVPQGKRRRHNRLMRGLSEMTSGPVNMKSWRQVEALRADGSRFPIHVWLAPDRHAGDRRTVVFARDMSELAASEAAATAAQAKLEEQGRKNALLALVAEHATDAVIITDAQGRTLWVNPALEQLSGYQADEFKGRKPGELLQGPETDTATVRRIAEAVKNGSAIQCELLNYHRDGEPYWLDMNITPVHDDAGQLAKFIAVERDITKVKQQENALKAAREAAKRAEDRLASAIEAISEGFVIYDAEDRLVMCNSALRAQFPFLSELLVPGAKFEDLIRTAALNGHFDTQGEDPEAWVRKQIEKRRASDRVETIVRFTNGRWMLRRECRTPDGEMIGVRSDITAFKQQEENLRQAKRKAERAENRLASAIEAISEGFAIYDEYDRLVMANDAFRRLHEGVADLIVPGVTFSEIVLAAARRKYFDTGGEDPETWVRKQVEKRRSQPQAETMVPFTDGRWMLRRERRTPEGEMIGIRSDITAFKAQEAALEEARAHAEAADQAKSEFVANISHELRTPINGIMGFIQLMLTGELDDKQRERAEIVKSSSEHLLQLVNDLLDLSRIASQSIELSPEWFDLAELVDDTVAMMEPLAKQKNIDLNADLSLPSGIVIEADRSRLRQILFNLVGNGINYTDHGQVTLRAHDGPPGVIFEVSDTGPGMPKDKLQTIFDRFSRIEGAGAASGGAGLGLAITKGLVDLMGGEIVVESELGEGSTFTVRLPLPAKAPARLPQPTAGAPEPAKIEQARSMYDVLVVEDHPVNQLLIRELLTGISCQVSLAENGLQALEQVEAHDFDLIIMDNQMPEMSGLEAISEIRARDDWKRRIPIIALTANAMRGAETPYQEHGVEAFLTKPFDMNEVLATVQRLGKVGREIRDAAAPAAM